MKYLGLQCVQRQLTAARPNQPWVKAELIHKNGPWKGLDDVERATLIWVEWFNNRRLLQPIGDVPPAEYEMLYYQTGSSKAA